MKAMNKALAMMAGVLCLSMASCSSDEPAPNPELQGGDVYAQLTLRLPETRSTTTDDGQSTNGNEYGKDFENNIESIRIVLAQKVSDNEYTYIAQGTTESAILDQSQKNTYSITFQSEELEQFAGNDGTPGGGTGASQEVYVFAYCNPTQAVIAQINALSPGDPFGNEMATIATEAEADNLPWAQENGFMMTNHSTQSVMLPNYQTLIRQHNTKATAFNLGTVEVERVVSRFDFEPTSVGEGARENQYLVKDNVSGLYAAYIEINGMSLINEAKQFYLLPRISNNADWSAPIICGSENVSNWMVSPNYDAKSAFALPDADYTAISGNYFFANPQPATLTYTMTKNIADNDDWTGASGTNYKIWRYATENTMPTAAMKKGITTGIVFRGEIKPYTGTNNVPAGQRDPAQTLAAAMTAGVPIYAWTADAKNPENNIMLGSAKDVWRYAYAHAASAIRTNFKDAVTAGNFTVKHNGTTVTTEADLFPALQSGQNFEDLAAEFEVTGFTANPTAIQTLNQNFMVYVPTDGHYYVYYHYYNRHNDNNMPDLMGPMEFATVRNNIYKLKVTKVAAFGTPGDILPPPGTNDETPEVYFKVAVKVLDWVVRVNNIEF